MPGPNSFGNQLIMTSFGESHGVAMGVVVDGVPAQVPFDLQILVGDLDKRRPGSRGADSAKEQIVSQRNESDLPEILSGVFEGKTLGTPIAIIFRNHDQKSSDYESVKANPRAGHADQVWISKFGIADHRGGGRSSGRETVARVAAGAVAKMILKQLCPHLQVRTYAKQIAGFQLTHEEIENVWSKDIEDYEARFPSETSQEVQTLLLKAKAEGESYGGIVEMQIKGLPIGLGQPVFKKLKADLASALMGIGATTGFEIGEGFQGLNLPGTQFHKDKEGPQYGGIQGGISNGQPLILRVGFKPTSSILDIAKKGRHDPCIVIRAVPVVEAMVMFVIADHLLWSKTDRI